MFSVAKLLSRMLRFNFFFNNLRMRVVFEREILFLTDSVGFLKIHFKFKLVYPSGEQNITWYVKHYTVYLFTHRVLISDDKITLTRRYHVPFLGIMEQCTWYVSLPVGNYFWEMYLVNRIIYYYYNRSIPRLVANLTFLIYRNEYGMCSV